VRRFVAGFFTGIAVSCVLLVLVGHVLDVEDPLKPADVIVALSGDTGARTETAVELWRRAYAPLIIFAGASEDPKEQNITSNGTLSWYRPDFFHGHHEFKGGYEFVDSFIGRARESHGAVGDFQLNFRNGAPLQVVTFNFPVKPVSKSRYLGLYVMDNWVIGRRLTLNVGTRFAHDNGFIPEQCRGAGQFAVAQCYDAVQFPIWNSFAPRIHASLDLFGSGRTVIKAAGADSTTAG